uniref:Putative ovule protein n=1 Tax=Solanum chacoense TaxID=4108 RepID=A0A0V0GMD2_SOLCH
MEINSLSSNEQMSLKYCVLYFALDINQNSRNAFNMSSLLCHNSWDSFLLFLQCSRLQSLPISILSSLKKL